MTDMKKIIFACIVTILALSSCEGMLDEVNYGNPTTKDMMSKEENVALLVGQAYADVKWLHDHWGYWGVVTLTADEGICPIRMPDKDWADGNYWRNLNTHNWDVMGQAFRNIWNTTISGAVLCNKLISTLQNNMESMSKAVFAQYVGELEVMRSYYYYMLFDCFGRIPYQEEFEATTEPLMAPEKVWSRLVDCLEKNAPNLPVVNDANRAVNYGRATQGFAYALLARLYLNAESFGCTPSNIDITNSVTSTISTAADFYTNAVRCCDAVINAKSYSIEENFFTNFKINNEGSKENIFVIVENGNAKFDARSNGSMSNKLRLTILTLNYNHQQTYNMIEKPWNGFCARPSFIERYNKEDVRGAGTDAERALGTNATHQWGWFVGPIYAADGKTLLKDKDEAKSDAIIVPTVSSLTEATDLEGARMFKYEVDREGKYDYCENDFVLFRYADVLWMKEEAILRGGSGTSSANSADFKRLRERCFGYNAGDKEAAYIAAYPKLAPGALDLDAILDERGREFAWENMRRRDLIRFGKFNDSDYVEFVTGKDDYRKWFPIPYAVLESSLRDENDNPIWTQNPGY